MLLLILPGMLTNLNFHSAKLNKHKLNYSNCNKLVINFIASNYFIF